MTWAAYGQKGLASIAFIGTEKPAGTLRGEVGGVGVSEREFVLSAALVVADAGAVTEGRRVAVRLELIRPKFEALVGLRTGFAECAVIGGVCAKSPEREKERGWEDIHEHQTSVFKDFN